MAERLFNHMAAHRGLQDWEARSAGTKPDPAFPTPPAAHAVLAERGITADPHAPQAVSPELLEWADLVLALAQSHLDWLLKNFPKQQDKLLLFLDYAGFGAKDVADPIGGSQDVYRSTRDDIEAGLQALMERDAHGTIDEAGS
jgi:protein-tyrosine phosphatase